MKFLTRNSEKTETKWLSFEGQVGEVNASVLDLYEKKQAEQKELNTEQIVTEAKQLAMSEMPDEVQDLVLNLKGRFKNSEDLKKEKNVEGAKEVVREMVFAVIDEGISRYSDWDSNLEDLVDDVENDEAEAILTIKDTQRGINAVENILAQYKRQAGILAERQDKTNKTKRKFGFLWKTGEHTGTSEKSLFDGFSNIAEAEIKVILDKFKAKSAQAETIHRENKDLIESGFKALSPDEKSEFIKRADEEVSTGKDKFKTGLTTKWKAVGAVVSGVDVLQRVEIFPKLLEPGKAKLLQASSDKVDLERKRFEQRESFIQGKAQLTFTQPNIDDVKTELTDVKPDTSFNEGGLNDLNQEITLFFRANSIDVSGLYKYGGKKLSPEQLNEYETFTILFQAIFDHKDKLIKAPKELKKKILAACGWLEGIDVSETKDGYSEDFVDVKEKIKDWSNYTQADLKILGATSDLNSIDSANFVRINKATGELDLIKKELANKKDLTATEKNILANFIKEAETVLKKLKDLSIKWEQQEGFLNKDKKELKRKEKSKQAEIDALKNQHRLIEDKITDITSGLGSTAAPSGTLKEKIDLETLIASLETEFEDLDTKYHYIFRVIPPMGYMSPDPKHTDYKKYKKEQNDLNSKITTAKSKLSLANSNLETLKKEVADLTKQKKDKNLEISLASSQHKQITEELSALKTFTPDTADDYEFTNPSIFLAEIEATIETLVAEVNDTKYDGKIKDNTTPEAAIASHFVYNSMRQNQDLYRERFTALQGEQFDILKGLTSGRGVNIKFTDYLHGTDLPDTMALNTAASVSGAVILEKTDDAVILLNGTYVVIVQKSTQHDKYQVLKLPAPAGFDGKTNLPPDFFPQNASLVGELIQLTPA